MKATRKAALWYGVRLAWVARGHGNPWRWVSDGYSLARRYGLQNHRATYAHKFWTDLRKRGAA